MMKNVGKFFKTLCNETHQKDFVCFGSIFVLNIF